MDKKYYYIQYTITCKTFRISDNSNCVSDKHPFKWLEFYKGFSSEWSIIDWKEISEEEYLTGKDIIGTG